jgi:hypothetical protein
MQVIACLIPGSGGERISPFHEYMERYAAPPDSNEEEQQKTKREKQVAHIQESIKHVWDHNGAMNLPPTVEPYKNRKISIIKIKLADCLVRIAFYTIKNEMILLAAMDKPKRYEKASKNKIDKEIQQFLNEAEQNLEIYLKTYQGIDITKRIVG